MVLGDPILVQDLHLLEGSLALFGGHGGGLLDGLLGLGSHGILNEHSDGSKDSGNQDVQEDQLGVDPGLDGLGEGDGAVVDENGEVVLVGVDHVGHEGQSNLAGGMLHLDGVGQDQGAVSLEGGAIFVGSQLYCQKECKKRLDTNGSTNKEKEKIMIHSFFPSNSHSPDKNNHAMWFVRLCLCD